MGNPAPLCETPVQRSKRFLATVLSEIAFHEKAGRSQVGSGCFLLVTDIVSAELPLSPPFHPHSL